MNTNLGRSGLRGHDKPIFALCSLIRVAGENCIAGSFIKILRLVHTRLRGQAVYGNGLELGILYARERLAHKMAHHGEFKPGIRMAERKMDRLILRGSRYGCNQQVLGHVFFFCKKSPHSF